MRPAAKEGLANPVPGWDRTILVSEYRVSGRWLASTTVLALQPIPCNFRVGGTEPAKYPVCSTYHTSMHNEHDVCFHVPGR
jgi:hypothetical protein